MNKILKWALIIIFSILFLYAAASGIFLLLLFKAFEKTYSKQDLIDNYRENRREIMEVRKYIHEIVPAGKTVDIEFEDAEHLFIFHLAENGVYDGNWDLGVHSAKTDTLLRKLGWAMETLRTLKEKLDKANCISVQNGEPCTIGFQRSGMGKYFYKVFREPIPEEKKERYNDGCHYILYNDTIVLEYGGGAVGSQCFEREP